MLKEIILAKAVEIAKVFGINRLTRRTVAHASACAVGTVNYHFETMDALRNEVVSYAVANEVVEVIAQARAIRHPGVRRLSPALKERVAAHVAGR
jgi:DNA-binding transcriptional regulator YbjK